MNGKGVWGLGPHLKNFRLQKPRPVVGVIHSTKNLFNMFFWDTFFGKLGRTTKRETQSDTVSSMYDAHRERIRYAFEKVPEFASVDGDYFVFAHIMAPHPPYVFGPNGEEINGDGAFTLDNVMESSRDGELYVGEIQYINSLVAKMVDEILRESEVPPIIIIQADHGSRFMPENDQSVEMSNMLDYSILNAYFLPGLDTEKALYPSISPVNTFRLVLNNYFGANLALLEDKSFDWDKNTDYNFIQIPVLGE